MANSGKNTNRCTSGGEGWRVDWLSSLSDWNPQYSEGMDKNRAMPRSNQQAANPHWTARCKCGIDLDRRWWQVIQDKKQSRRFWVETMQWSHVHHIDISARSSGYFDIQAHDQWRLLFPDGSALKVHPWMVVGIQTYLYSLYSLEKRYVLLWFLVTICFQARDCALLFLLSTVASIWFHKRSQFFISLKSCEHLNNKHSVSGPCIKTVSADTNLDYYYRCSFFGRFCGILACHHVCQSEFHHHWQIHIYVQVSLHNAGCEFCESNLKLCP